MLQKIVPNILQYAQELHLPAGSFVYEIGEPKKGIFHIHKGGVAVFHRSRAAKDGLILTHFAGRGYTIGINCIEDPTHINTAKTLLSTTFYHLDTAAVQLLMEENIAFRLFFLQEACKQIEHLELKIFKKTHYRKADLVLGLLKELCQILDEETRLSHLILPTTEICHTLQISSSFLQNIILDLVMKECIEVHNNTILLRKPLYFLDT